MRRVERVLRIALRGGPLKNGWPIQALFWIEWGYWRAFLKGTGCGWADSCREFHAPLPAIGKD